MVQRQPFQDASVINSSIVSAVQGHYSNYHLTEKTRGSVLWISPLMSLYWFFDLPSVADHNLFLSQIGQTETFMDALKIFLAFRRQGALTGQGRDRKTLTNIPL